MSHKRAVGVEVHGIGWGKLGAMNARGTQTGLDLGCVGGAFQVKLAGQVAAPAGVRTEKQPCELPELSLAPLQINAQRHLAQFGGLMQIRCQAHHSGVGLLNAQVGAGGLAAQLNAPIAGVLLFQGELRIDQGKRQLFRTALDVDPGVCRLQVGQLDGFIQLGYIATSRRGLSVRGGRA